MNETGALGFPFFVRRPSYRSVPKDASGAVNVAMEQAYDEHVVQAELAYDATKG